MVALPYTLAPPPEAPSRQAARQRELKDALLLALVPAGVALTLGMLLFPHRGAPDSVPLPIPDARQLARTQIADLYLAEAASKDPLPAEVRALGSAIRDFHTLEALRESSGDMHRLGEARRKVDTALLVALALGDEGILRLRAVQLAEFTRELRAFEATGVETPELSALAGTFVQSMRESGWCEGRAFVPREPALLAMFKEMWNSFLGLGARAPFALSLDEHRAIYELYLAHPHPAPAMRDAIAAARRGAHGAAACEAVALAERRAIESWRLERIARLQTIDPEYPAAYARGVASLRRGSFTAAADAFRSWLRDHPEGPLTLRAQSFLRAAIVDERAE